MYNLWVSRCIFCINSYIKVIICNFVTLCVYQTRRNAQRLPRAHLFSGSGIAPRGIVNQSLALLLYHTSRNLSYSIRVTLIFRLWHLIPLVFIFQCLYKSSCPYYLLVLAKCIVRFSKLLTYAVRRFGRARSTAVCTLPCVGLLYFECSRTLHTYTLSSVTFVNNSSVISSSIWKLVSFCVLAFDILCKILDCKHLTSTTTIDRLLLWLISALVIIHCYSYYRHMCIVLRKVRWPIVLFKIVMYLRYAKKY